MIVLNCSDYLDFRVGEPEQTRDTAYFHVIGNGGDRFGVSNAHCMYRTLF